ncbi:hypothetical protein PAMC26510_27780 [Caballeronia sordidicola]|uniref:Uncharacterized protein n=1 Tax=Caballeronia sordidicola TaxID=196367 RepID=A0A242MCV4_CABSO|nr:hypothetical protein PAMC26510_27780 [Caballeronia sordidicola]OTP72309.1 hypothetical protein PAMC26577_21410 [Caballeronia sordidicola]
METQRESALFPLRDRRESTALKQRSLDQKRVAQACLPR